MGDTLVGGGDATWGPAEAFGRYRLLSLLGQGGMGQVWRAHDSLTNRVVALKVLPERFADDEQLRERFRRECRAVAQLTEPHVIPIHDFGDIDGRLYLNMRLIEGTDLRKVITREGALSPRRAVAIIAQVAGALQAAHDAGLVHRDVKPTNILLGADEFASLIDFGIAHAADDLTLTAVGETIGTVAYMAPEEIGAEVKADARVDVYALTCVLYECLTGRPPFASELGIQGVMAHHLHTPPPRPSTTTPDVPTAFDAVIAKGMAKNPDSRYQTVRELAAAACAAVGDSAVSATVAVAARHGRRIRLSPKTAGLLAAAVAVTVVAAVAVVIGVQRESGDGGDSPTPIAPGYSAQTPLPFTGVSLPTDVAVDTAGNVYVTDMGNDRVVKLAAGASTPTPLPFIGLNNPQGVAVDTAGNVYVTDTSNDRVVKLAAGASTPTPLPFTGLKNPHGVAVDRAGDVYVADWGNDRVVRLAAGAAAPTTLPFTGLRDPQGLAVDTAGNIYITELGTERVVMLAAGASEPTTLPFTGLKDPQGVAVDTAGDLYIVDWGNKWVVRLAAGASTPTPLPFTGLKNPQGVAVDTADNVYVTDLGHDPVVKLPVG
ncbi:serine/threonine-protein kinase PknD [Nocardia sp. NBC_00508]|uniref:serine/threonine-protein kinase PknD n=1 Tax=Nocardia sp. NBC_00508 TaxID=2975992 RepID=UPI002E813528|nr:serine/threonine-protein kinase PknD [Nocardia sp. NBC_00508]WUD67832.1 serine/threonine-protein kinase PknD [Nocardia sp. NBC_00508]